MMSQQLTEVDLDDDCRRAWEAAAFAPSVDAFSKLSFGVQGKSRGSDSYGTASACSKPQLGKSPLPAGTGWRFSNSRRRNYAT
jgi:hypothetical protein